MRYEEQKQKVKFLYNNDQDLKNQNQDINTSNRILSTKGKITSLKLNRVDSTEWLDLDTYEIAKANENRYNSEGFGLWAYTADEGTINYTYWTYGISSSSNITSSYYCQPIENKDYAYRVYKATDTIDLLITDKVSTGFTNLTDNIRCDCNIILDVPLEYRSYVTIGAYKEWNRQSHPLVSQIVPGKNRHQVVETALNWYFGTAPYYYDDEPVARSQHYEETLNPGKGFYYSFDLSTDSKKYQLTYTIEAIQQGGSIIIGSVGQANYPDGTFGTKWQDLYAPPRINIKYKVLYSIYTIK